MPAASLAAELEPKLLAVVAVGYVVAAEHSVELVAVDAVVAGFAAVDLAGGSAAAVVRAVAVAAVSFVVAAAVEFELVGRVRLVESLLAAVAVNVQEELQA